MRWKQADFLAGLFVIGGFALIIAIVVVVRGQIGAPDRYHTFFKNVAGLRAGAAVVYEGYIIGSVSDVDPVPDETGMQFRVNLDVEKDWVIPSDSVAEISAVSLLSANAIQISAGTAAPLAPGSEIDSITAVNVMAEISKTADELTDIAQSHLAPLLVTLRDVLDTEGRGALSSVSVLSGALAEDAPRIMSNIESATANVAAITSSQNAESINRTISNVETASQEVVKVAEDAAAVTSGVMQVASNDNVERIDGILDTLDSAAVQLEETMQAASRTTSRMEEAVSVENLAAINAILADMRLIQADIATIVSTSISTSDNLQSITEAGEDRINGLLQRMEAAAINVEEMTGRLRDDPSLIIRGSE